MDKFVIIGASYLQVPLISKANEMGFETHVFAWEEGAVGKYLCHHFYPVSITRKEEIGEIVKKIEPVGIASISSDLAVITVNHIANLFNLVGNSEESSKLTTHKFLMRQKLFENGLKCPKFILIKNNDISFNQIKELNFPIIVKPTDRSGSRGVTKINSKEEYEDALCRAFEVSFNNEIIVEEFIDGIELSVEMISYEGIHYFLNTTKKVTSGDPFFVELQHHEPAQVSEDMLKNIKTVLFRALDALGIRNGASHNEIIITNQDEVYIVEIGSRMGGDFIGSKLVQLSTGYDFVKGVIEVACGKFKGVDKSLNKCSGVYYLNPKPGKVQKIIDNSSIFPEVIEKNLFININENIEHISDSSKRPGYFIYQSNVKFDIESNQVINIITSN